MNCSCHTKWPHPKWWPHNYGYADGPFMVGFVIFLITFNFLIIQPLVGLLFICFGFVRFLFTDKWIILNAEPEEHFTSWFLIGSGLYLDYIIFLIIYYWF